MRRRVENFRDQTDAVAAARGDREARDRLVRNYQSVAAGLAWRESRDCPASREDLLQEAMIALLDAIERFDPSRGVPFGAWAATLMRRAVIEYAHGQRPLGGLAIRLPRHVWAQLREVDSAEQALIAQRRAASDEQVAGRTGLTARRVGELRALRAVHRAGELDGEAADHGRRPDEVAELRDVEKRVAAALKRLSDRQRAAALAHDRGDLADLAAAWGVPARAVGDVRRGALRALAHDHALRPLARR